MSEQGAEMTEAEIQAAQQSEPPPSAQQQQLSIEQQLAPGPVAVSESEALQFVYDGRQRMTALAVAIRDLREWADTFEQRGGAATYGDDALAMVYAYNDLTTGFLNPDKRALFARLRTDI